MRMVLTALVWLFILIMVVGFGGALIMVGYAHDRKGLLRPDDLDPADGLAHAADHDPGLILDLLPSGTGTRLPRAGCAALTKVRPTRMPLASPVVRQNSSI